MRGLRDREAGVQLYDRCMSRVYVNRVIRRGV